MKSLYRECLKLGLESDSTESIYVFAESVLYLVGISGAFAFQSHVRAHCHSCSAKKFRLRLCESRYSNLTIKMFVLQVASSKMTRSQAIARAKRHGLTKRDVFLILQLLDENVWFKTHISQYVKLNRFTDEELSYTELNATFNRIYPEVLKYIKHITWTKLRFLVQSTNGDFSDYHSELSAKLVQSYYAIAPIQMSDAHLINYLKRSAHNHAINMIKSGTTKKRGRLISEQDTNGAWRSTSLCLSQNQMALTSEGTAADVDGIDDSADVFQLRFAISEVLDSMNANTSKYRFLTLLLGAEDIEFSKWLSSKGHTEGDNVDIQQAIGADAYTKLASEFLRLSKDHVASFLESLRLQLAW